MQKKPVSDIIPQTPLPTNWLAQIQDDHLRLVIPLGSRFQADIPDLSTRNKKKFLEEYSSDSSRWLGTNIWTPKSGSQLDEKEIIDVIGRGRPDYCPCKLPGSVECVQKHLTVKRTSLQFELGPAFWRWKFNEMGDSASKLWTPNEQTRFESVVKMNPLSEGKSFLVPALESLPSQSRQSIVNYYLNIYLPRRISMQTRSGFNIVDTDDEEPFESPQLKSSRKRCQADVVHSYSPKIGRTRYLTGRR